MKGALYSRRVLVGSAVLGIAMLGVMAWTARLSPYLGGGDDAFYILLGLDLAENGQYRAREVPGEPPHAHYPPGYPLLVAAVARLIGATAPLELVRPLAVLNLAFLLAIVLLFLVLQKDRERLALVLAATCLFAFHPLTIGLAGSALTELPALFSTLAGILAFHRWIGSEAGPPSAIMGRWIAATAALALPVYIRSNAIALGLAAIALLVLQRRLRAAMVTGGLWGLFLLPLFLFMRRPGTEGGYVTFWAARDIEAYDGAPLTVGDLVPRLIEGIHVYGKMLPDVIFYWGPFSGLWWIAAPVLGLAALGLVMRLRAGIRLDEVYVLCFLAMLVAFPARSLRYLVPVLPFLQLYVVKGLETSGGTVATMLRLERPARWSAAAIVVLIALGVVSGVRFHHSEAREAKIPPAQRQYHGWVPGQWAAIEWLGAHTPPDAVIMLRKAHILFVLTGRRGVSYPYTSPDDVRERITAADVQFVVEEPSRGGEWYLRPALDRLESEGRARLVHETEGRVPNRIWRITSAVNTANPASGAQVKTGQFGNAVREDARTQAPGRRD